MIIKSEEFNFELMKQIPEILINRRSPPNIVGSYKIKKNGELITDIDLNQPVFATESFLSRLRQTIMVDKSFRFIHLICGQYDIFKLPWKFDDSGSCVFEKDKVLLWCAEMHGFIPEDLYLKIKTLIESKSLCIKDLFHIRDLLKDFSRIIWNKKDIENGFKEFNGKKYYLLNLMKEGFTTLAVFLYKYKDDYCTIDSSYVDKNYGVYGATIYDYYMDNKYRIFKSMKRMVKPEYFGEFVEAVARLQNYSSINSSLSMLDIAKKYGLISEREIELLVKKIESFAIKNKIELKNLKKEIERISIENIEYFQNKIADKFKAQIILFKIRMKEVNSPIAALASSPSVSAALGLKASGSALASSPSANAALSLKASSSTIASSGFTCPFFFIQSAELQKLIDISIRAQISAEKLVECVTDLCTEEKMDAKTIINAEFSSDNSAKIEKIGDAYFFNHKKLSEKELVKTKIYILFGKKNSS